MRKIIIGSAAVCAAAWIGCAPPGGTMAEDASWNAPNTHAGEVTHAEAVNYLMRNGYQGQPVLDAHPDFEVADRVSVQVDGEPVATFRFTDGSLLGLRQGRCEDAEGLCVEDFMVLAATE